MPKFGQGVKKINARAFSRANRTIGSLKAEVDKLKRKMKGKSKQIERLCKRVSLHKPKTGQLTPKKKTMADLEALKLAPRRKQIARRQLLTFNVLMHKIHKTKKHGERKKITACIE